ncbi:CCAAT/enhancer-binding protein zeta-like [Lineus longissimus]|uniref:CCAAT/enhancer-binding protein zeta-like n=1 Tax=Lineus longissimus TaxID=88925 RepID=UPI002B4DFEEB
MAPKHVGSETKNMKKKTKKKGKMKDVSFDLETVLALGGDKKDYDMLKDADDGDEVIINPSEDFEAEPIQRESILEYIKELEITKYREPTDDEKRRNEPRPVKLLSMPVPSDDEEEEAVVPKKKKQKNKFKIQHDEISSSTEIPKPKKGSTAFISQYHPRNYILVKSAGSWYSNQFPNDPAVYHPADDTSIENLRHYASRLLEDDTKLYKNKKDSSKSSDVAWMKKVISSGTLSDKVAGLTVLIQDDLVHNLSCLDTLINMVTTKGKRECLLALDTLKELFLSDLLPDNRKLKTFEQHPLSAVDELASGNKDSRDKRLLMWYVEDQLKEAYAKFVKALEGISHDTLPASKKKAMNVIFELLISKPEQEKVLLMMLINKLGDPDYKIASKGAHFLTQLVEKHPNMKHVLTLEIERLLYRTNISPKAQYYAICFLNQIILSQAECKLATRLIGVYFSFFKSYVKKGEVDSKMMSALLSGVNRAYPFATDKEKIGEQMNTLYKLVHIVNFNTSIQALMLLYQVMGTNENLSDRYYMALYKKLLDPDLRHCSKQAMFLNLLFKSLTKDDAEKRVMAFLKRLLQICSYQSPCFVCAALVLFSEVIKAKPGLLNLQNIPEDSDDEEHFVDLDEDDKVEVDSSDDETKPRSYDAEPKHLVKSWSSAGAGSWVHRKNVTEKSFERYYDPYHRNPLYCRAEQECIWELKKMATHFHPSVALFAGNILKGEKIVYSGDPLQDFTLIRFLDRFVYRNPKKKDKDNGGEALPTSQGIKSKNKQYIPKGVRAVPVNSEKYLAIPEAKIPIDEKFFYRFFHQQAGRKKEKHDSDNESISDDEFDNYLDKYESQYGGDADDMKFDFAGEFDKKKNKRGKKGGTESDSDSDDVDDLSDEEVDFGDDFDAQFGSDDDLGDELVASNDEPEFDEENVAFSDEDDLGEMDFTKKAMKGKRKMSGLDDEDDEDFLAPPRKRGMKGDVTSLFAAAEEFSHLIDETNDDDIDMTGTEALSNVKDKASVKQLKWEQNRDKWVRGEDWKTKKRQQGKFKGKGPNNKMGKQQKGKRNR